MAHEATAEPWEGFGELRRHSSNDNTRREHVGGGGKRRISLRDNRDKSVTRAGEAGVEIEDGSWYVPRAQQWGSGEPSGGYLRKRAWDGGGDDAHSQRPASPQPKPFPSQRGGSRGPMSRVIGLARGDSSRRVATEEAAGSDFSGSDAKASGGGRFRLARVFRRGNRPTSRSQSPEKA